MKSTAPTLGQFYAMIIQDESQQVAAAHLVANTSEINVGSRNVTPAIMEDEESFVSETDAIIYAASDMSGWTHSLISDNNIPNSSSSTSVYEHQQQQQISTAACDDDDSMFVSSSASYSWFKTNKQIDDHQEIRIFNVDFRALCNNTCGGSELHGGLLPDTE
ncbi:hypothetical protein MTR67_045385 [Solanum verrucosum]|uniref:Uncharacterized protein n=1 Tax=Solanum verrucosum TaxID=315347 RepID=A0AAF0USK9_SOLVR|nr:hypothetical protein MTR67_045385 [Solanum verrucosum]